MRKRIIRKGERVSNKVWTPIILSLVLCVVCSCAPALRAPFHSDPDVQKSWNIYCERYNVNKYNPTEEQYDRFLDCWSGSVEEEIAVELYK